MANPLYWPGKYFLYAIGNTSAVCLTRDLAPEEPADVFLLGCGDPRSILYTVHCEPQDVNRSLDFTCCDYEPGVLARNVILLSMAADKQPITTMWNIFYHLYIDKESLSALTTQCTKLIGFSDNLKRWNSSGYGKFLQMSSEYTLSELRRHWSLYRDMKDMSPDRLKSVRDDFAAGKVNAIGRQGTPYSSARSYGPLMTKAVEISNQQFHNYWKSGTTFTDSKSIAAATVLNPTFVYTLAGEGFNVHYGSDPLTSFHLAPLLGNAKKPKLSVANAVNAAKLQFTEWCTSYQRSVSSTSVTVPVVRFLLGDAITMCHALRAVTATGALESQVPVADWKTELVKLSKDVYGAPSGAPAVFNVIDTSNLADYFGLLNILTATVPLLTTESTRSSVLYTESLLFIEQDATKEFNDNFNANIATVGLLINLTPIDYLSGFTSRSNTHELMIYRLHKGNSPQFHQVTTWKPPASGDPIATRNGSLCPPPVLSSSQLATFLYDMYHQTFEQEDPSNFLKANQGNLLNAVAFADIRHYYIRESFVMFLKLVRDRLSFSEDDWHETMVKFFDLQDADQSMGPWDEAHTNDLNMHLHLQGLIAIGAFINNKAPKVGRFTHWDDVTPFVRIFLVVPRQKLKVLEDSLSTPPLHCDLRGKWSQNIFSTIHVAFGKIIPTGTKGQPSVAFEEDMKGRKGTSPLVVSFTLPATLLTAIEPMEDLEILFSVKNTAKTMAFEFVKKLGMAMTIFSAKVLDEKHVHVIPDHSTARIQYERWPCPSWANFGISGQIGYSFPPVVQLDEQCELISTLTIKMTVENEEVQRRFQSGSTPHLKQVSPCVMRITIRGHSQDLAYPYPVIGSECKLRLARKSLYIEAVVPVAGPFLKDDGMKLNPFAVVRAGRVPNPWNIHRLNLSCLPVLDTTAVQLYKWFTPHAGSMMSTRERSLQKKQQTDVLMFIKETLQTILVRSAGVQGGSLRRVFALRDEATNNLDTLFFINDVKYDLSSHTFVCDGYVLPLTPDLTSKIRGDLGDFMRQERLVDVSVAEVEMQGWKQLIPAFVERCRFWKHQANCEYESQGKIPLTEMMEADPLCSCGRGKDIEGMLKVDLWKKLAPYVTRIALSPLFAVSYLETVGRDSAAHKCSVCRGRGKPKLQTCAGCKKVRYCSTGCQKKDWKVHKSQCKP